ncbi:MAG: MarR family transcriptional regulator, partial [Cyanobacteria bacterium P01_D01_bin.44]
MSNTNTSRLMSIHEEIGEPLPLQHREQAVYLNLVRTHAILSDEVAKLFQQHGLSQPLYNVLKVVAREGDGGIPSQSIARFMVARDPDITRLVDKLKKEKLVTRRRDTQDRRVVRISATRSGKEIIQQLDPLIWKLHQQQLEHLSSEKLEVLNQLLVEARTQA